MAGRNRSIPDVEAYIPLEEHTDAEKSDNDVEVESTDMGRLSDAESEDDPQAFLSYALWSSTPGRKRSTVRLSSTKEIATYIKHAGNLDTALLKVISESDSSKFPEARVNLYVSELLRKEASISAIDEDGNTPLHLSAKRGYSNVAKELLRWEADPYAENNQHKTPLELAVHQALEGMQENVEDYNAFAVLMIREMEPAKVRLMFLSDIGTSPRLNFHALLDKKDMIDTVNAVLDKLIERVPGRKRTYTVYYDLLESNKDGLIVRNHNKMSLRRQLGKSVFHKIAWTANKDAISHLVIHLMMLSKWKRFARNFLIVHFSYWVLTMLAISIALILAASQPDPQFYDHPLDSFRAVCEGIAIFLVTMSSISEIYHIYLWRLSYFRDYSFFLFNYLNLVTMAFLIVIIPLRVFDFDEQWLFASFLYMSYAARILRYVNEVPFLGKYMQILFLIFRRDIIPFVCIVIVILFIFSGGIYFALRAEVITVDRVIGPDCNISFIENGLAVFNLTINQVNDVIRSSPKAFMTSLDINTAETSTYPRMFFTGLRIAVEGQNFLTYFGHNGFQWLGVLTYMIFLFTVEVILLNLLIAQMSDTFSNVQGDAKRSLAINQARTIISIEKTDLPLLKFLADFYKSEEKWTNPFQKHVDKLDKTSITNIHKMVLKTHRFVKQNVGAFTDMRGSFAEQNLATNEKLDLILRKLAELQR